MSEEAGHNGSPSGRSGDVQMNAEQFEVLVGTASAVLSTMGACPGATASRSSVSMSSARQWGAGQNVTHNSDRTDNPNKFHGNESESGNVNFRQHRAAANLVADNAASPTSPASPRSPGSPCSFDAREEAELVKQAAVARATILQSRNLACSLDDYDNNSNGDENCDGDNDFDWSVSDAECDSTGSRPSLSKDASGGTSGSGNQDAASVSASARLRQQRLREYGFRITRFVLLAVLFAIPALMTIAIESVPVPESLQEASDSDLVMCTVALEAALLGYHILDCVVGTGMAAFARRRRTVASLRTAAAAATLAKVRPYLSSVLLSLSAFVSVCTFVHGRYCDAAAASAAALAQEGQAVYVAPTLPLVSGRCLWPGWWIRPALGATTVTAALLFFEKCFLQYLAVDYHRQTYAERRQRSLLLDRVLVRLTRARKQAKTQQGDLKGNALSRDAAILGRNVARSEAVLGWRSGASVGDFKKSVATMVRSSNKVAESQDIDKGGKKIGTYGLGLKASPRGSRSYVGHFAKKTFEFLVGGAKRRYLTASDLLPHLSVTLERETLMAVLDKNDDGSVSRSEFKAGITAIFREHRDLAMSLGQTEMVFTTLDRICVVIVGFLSIFSWLLVFNVNFSSVFVSITSVVIALTFVFGNTARTVFESLVFILSVHPFDAGDLINVDGESFTVKHIRVLCTEMARGDGSTVYYSNSLLSNRIVINTRRSGDMYESVSYDVRLEALGECLHQRSSCAENKWSALNVGHESSAHAIIFSILRKRFIEAIREDRKNFTGSSDVTIREVVDGGRILRLMLSAQHRGNFCISSLRWERRAKMVFEFKKILDELGIKPDDPLMMQQPPVSFMLNNDRVPMQKNEAPKQASQPPAQQGQRNILAAEYVMSSS